MLCPVLASGARASGAHGRRCRIFILRPKAASDTLGMYNVLCHSVLRTLTEHDLAHPHAANAIQFKFPNVQVHNAYQGVQHIRDRPSTAL